MKKLLFILAISGFAFTARSQDTIFRKQKLDIEIGLGVPTATGDIKAGALFAIEPKYRLQDDIAVGLRFEYAAFDYQGGTNELGAKIALVGSFCTTGEYYLSNNDFRPFVGGGLGLFRRNITYQYYIGDDDPHIPVLTEPGLYPELGIEAGHFRMVGSYNVMAKNLSYFCFKVGFFFGGGNKNVEEIKYYRP